MASLYCSASTIADKPINLEANDIIRIIAQPNPDSSANDVEAFASILEIT